MSANGLGIDPPTIARRLGSRWWYSWPVGLTLALLGLTFSFGWGVQGTASAGHYLLVEVLGDLAGAGVLAMAALIHTRGYRRRLTPAWIVLATWIAIGGVRAAVFAAFDPEDAARWVNANISVPVWAVVVIYVFAAFDEGRTRALQAAQANKSLQEIKDSTTETLDRERHALIAALQNTVAAEITRLERLVRTISRSGTDRQLAELADRVATFSTEVVRETSYQLRVEAPLRVSEGTAHEPAVPMRRTLRHAILDVRQPLLIPVALIVLKGLSVALIRWDALSVGRTLLAFTCMGLVLWLGRSVLERFVRRPSVLEVTLSSAVTVVAAAFVMWTLAATRGSSADSSLLPLPAIGLFVVGVLLTARLVSAVQQRWSAVGADLEQANVHLADAHDRLTLELRGVREQLAEVLHGPVQGRLAAASMALRMYADARDDGRPADLERTLSTATTLLDRARGDIERLGTAAAVEPVTVYEGVEHIATTWSGLLAIDWTCSDSWPRSPELTHGIIDLIAELVTNASRHGDARRVTVDVHGVDRHTVVITAVDDGSGPKGTPSAGQGLGAVTKWNGSWHIDRTTDGSTRVKVVLRQG